MNSRLVCALVILGANCIAFANGQDREPGDPQSPALVTNSVPDWQSRYQEETARDYIRRRAQEKTAARQARIEGMRWLGHSPARPVVSTTPFMSRVPSWVGASPTSYWGSPFWPVRGYR
jgi:hypothetical protein